MEDLKRLYMLFTAYGFDFLAPLSSVRSVVSGKEDMGELKALDLVGLLGGEAADTRTYQLVLQSGDELLTLKVDSVAGIEEIAEGQIMSVPESLRNESNRYLSAIVRLVRDEKGEYPAYIVNPCVLNDMAE